MSRVVATIEARMASSRLPGKVLAEIGGRPALMLQVARMRRAERLDEIVLAITTNPADDTLAAWAESVGIKYFRGSEEDVLGRVVMAQQSAGADVCVPICGDCPLLDPAVIDASVEALFAHGCDFVTNSEPPGFPQGQDVQVVRFDVLRQVADRIDDPAVREHTCLYLHEHPERYSTFRLAPTDECNMPEQRLQLDYEEDLALIRAIHDALAPKHGEAFGVAEIVAFLTTNPEIAAINRHCEERAPRAMDKTAKVGE